MWRVRPIVKLSIFIIVACIIIEIGSNLILHTKMYYWYSLNETVDHFITTHIIVSAFDGAIMGLLLAIPMVLVTVIFFRDISKSFFYRWAMITVALLVSIPKWDRFLGYFHSAVILPYRHDVENVVHYTLYLLLSIIACNFAAGIYLRAVISRRGPVTKTK